MPSPNGSENGAERVSPDELAKRLGLPEALPHLVEALTHPSYANERRHAGERSNQRLEFLGDAALGLCATEALMRMFPEAGEGRLSFMRASLVSADALAAFAERVELGRALRLGRGAAQAGEGERKNVLADAVEAIVGAVFLDAGLEPTRALVSAIIGEPLARLAGEGSEFRDAKSLLQERVQAAGHAAPRYRTVGEEGPAHARTFVVVCESDGHALGTGRGRSKKLAEQAAAREALAALAAAPASEAPTSRPPGGAPEDPEESTP